MLHRRAGFGANWKQLQRDLRDGFAVSVDRVIGGESRERKTDEPDDFANRSEFLLKKAIESQQLGRLSAWWILKMYLGHNAFAERRALIWHNHFATSNRGVNSLVRMYRQNQIFREFGFGKFGTLLEKTVKDPAMLVWLNANDNRREHPNENLGRELLELFSLGVGNYTEDDVKEAARALTGWTVQQSIPMPADPFSESFEDKLQIQTSRKDTFFKTVLGETGDWDGDDLLRIVLQHPATAKRIAWRICDNLLGENVASPAAIAELANGIGEHDLDLGQAFETVLKSELFFSDKNLKSQIAPPETFVLGPLIALDTQQSPASTAALSNAFSGMGRSLFEPPNVGGWDGGRTWLNARTIVARSNFVHNIIRNGMNRMGKPPQFQQVVDQFEKNDSVQSVVTQLAELLLGIDRNDKKDDAMVQMVARDTEKQPHDGRWAFAAELLLNSSSAQLC